jgi:hypothetical protein
MADFTRRVKQILNDGDCYFLHYGKGDHETWFSPITGRKFTVDGSITKRTSANQTIKSAGLKIKV